MVLQKSLHAKNFEPGEWLIRFGYDDSLLDEIGLEIPVYLIHVSGHFGVANSKVLAIAKLSAVLKNPAGNAAYQHFEEGDKGSIEVGKLADLVAL